MADRHNTDSSSGEAAPKATPALSCRTTGADQQASDSARTLVYEPVFSPGQHEVASAMRYGSNIQTPSQTPKALGFTTSDSPSSGVAVHNVVAPGAPRQPTHDAPASSTPTAAPSSSTANGIQAGQSKLSTPPATKLPF